jgi:hypothetical protein
MRWGLWVGVGLAVGHVADACEWGGGAGEEGCRASPTTQWEHDYAAEVLCKRLHTTLGLLTLQVKQPPPLHAKAADESSVDFRLSSAKGNW